MEKQDLILNNLSHQMLTYQFCFEGQKNMNKVVAGEGEKNGTIERFFFIIMKAKKANEQPN